MNYRDKLVEEMGYVICPLCFPEYTYCDEKCEECEHYINFMQGLKERGEIK